MSSAPETPRNKLARGTDWGPPGPALPIPPLAAPATKGISHARLALGHKWLLIGFLLVGAIAGIAMVTFSTPLYDSAVTVELVGFNQSFMNMNSVDPQGGTDANSASISNIQTQLKILTSRTLLKRVIDRMNLELTPVATAPSTTFTRLRDRLPFLRQQPLVQSRQAIMTAAATVAPRSLGVTRILEIQCKSTSPEIAADFLNTLVNEHIAQSVASRGNVTQRTSQWMDSQLEDARARLQQANEKLRDFVQKSGVDFFPEQTTLADNKMRSLQNDVSGLQNDRVTKQAKWEKARATPIENLAEVTNDPILQGLKNDLAALHRQMAQLTATLTPENYRVQRVQAQITETERTLEVEKRNLLKRYESDYQEALSKERLLLSAYNAQTRSLAAQSDKAGQYAMFKREVDTQQTLYNGLLTSSNQAALVALAPTSSVRILDAAVPAGAPISPKPVPNILGCALGGLGLGYALVFLREMSRRKKATLLFDAPGHTRLVLGVPELGVIPSALIEGGQQLAFSSGSSGYSSNGGGYTAKNGNGHDPGTLQSQPHSLLADSFRQTLVSLLRTAPVGHNPVYTIASAYPGEGKSTLSANLAAAMADTGKRVLLVDADLRRASLHTMFGSDEGHLGLGDILSYQGPIEELVLENYIQKTPREHLMVMTHGAAQIEAPARLLFSPTAERLIAKLQQRFDCLVLDTPPALAFPDARLWGRHSDGVVLIVRSGVTTREGAATVCQRFRDDGIPVLGTILNDWQPTDTGHDPYYYAGYGSLKAKKA